MPESPGAEIFKPAIRTKALHLKIPSPLYKGKEQQPKQSSRVLTSKENFAGKKGGRVKTES